MKTGKRMTRTLALLSTLAVVIPYQAKAEESPYADKKDAATHIKAALEECYRKATNHEVAKASFAVDGDISADRVCVDEPAKQLYLALNRKILKDGKEVDLDYIIRKQQTSGIVSDKNPQQENFIYFGRRDSVQYPNERPVSNCFWHHTQGGEGYTCNLYAKVKLTDALRNDLQKTTDGVSYSVNDNGPYVDNADAAAHIKAALEKCFRNATNHEVANASFSVDGDISADRRCSGEAAKELYLTLDREVLKGGFVNNGKKVDLDYIDHHQQTAGIVSDKRPQQENWIFFGRRDSAQYPNERPVSQCFWLNIGSTIQDYMCDLYAKVKLADALKNDLYELEKAETEKTNVEKK